MKLSTTLAALCAALPALAQGTETTTSPSTQTTPAPSLVDDSPDLELRQVGLVDPDAALTGATGAGPVTTYVIASNVGKGVATQLNIVYTQTFANVPDQWPSPKAGTIGMGTLQKRQVEAKPTGSMLQTFVVEMVTAMVTVPVRRVTSVIVVEVVTVGLPTGVANGTVGNGTVLGSNGTLPASMGLRTPQPLYTATG